MTIYLGLAGKIGSGKSTVAKMIAEKYPNALIVSFAHRLKQMVHAAFVTTPQLSLDDKTHLTPVGFTTGQLLQLVGEGMRRVISPTIWIDMVKADLLVHDSPHLVVFTDVRSLLELEFIRNLGGIIIHIVGREPSLEQLGGRDENAKTEMIEDLLSDHVGEIYNVDNTNITITELQKSIYSLLHTLQC